MIKELIFGNNQIVFKSSGATPILFKQTFKEDVIIITRNLAKKREELKKIKDKESEDYINLALEVEEITTPLIQQLAFVMWVEGNFKGEEVYSQLTQPKYIDFLMKFEVSELVMRGAEILAIYNNNTITLSKLKNE